jgi:hypothetical protein
LDRKSPPFANSAKGGAPSSSLERKPKGKRDPRGRPTAAPTREREKKVAEADLKIGHYKTTTKEGLGFGVGGGGFGALDYEAEAGVEAFAVAYGELEGAIIRGEDEDIAGGIENGGTGLAVLEVQLDVAQKQRIELMIEILRDVFPNVFASDTHVDILPKKPLRAGRDSFR